MCTEGDQKPGGVMEALRVLDATLDYINGPLTAELPAGAHGDALAALGRVSAKLGAARAQLLSRFDATRGHDADGYGSSAAWLAAMTGVTRKAANADVRRMRQSRRHPVIAQAQARGEVSESWAAEMAEWTRRLPTGLREGVDKLLVDTAAAGANLEDLAIVARTAYERWRSQQPDPDDPDDGFDDRYLKLGTTIDNAGRVTGDLTPECTAAVQAVLESLGKRRGPEDDRSEPQRFHDALQEACELLIRAGLAPDRAGADTRVDAVISLGELLALPCAPQLQEAWLAALAGQHAHLAGKDAEAAACDALIAPVVTGHPDLAVVDQMIDIILAFLDADEGTQPGSDAGHADACAGAAGGDASERERAAGDAGSTQPGSDTRNADACAGTGGDASERAAAGGNGYAGKDHAPGATGPCDGCPADPAATTDATPAGSARRPGAPSPQALSPQALSPQALSPQAWQAVRYAIARLAVELVSGPGGLAAALRQGLLPPPYNTKPVILDIGYSSQIPGSIRRAVALRARHCEWPGCRKRPAACDVHHLRHKSDGGETSVQNCVLLCQFHHDICIHRWGWRLTLHPDGTTTARGPKGQVIHSHGPPGGWGPSGTRRHGDPAESTAGGHPAG